MLPFDIEQSQKWHHLVRQVVTNQFTYGVSQNLDAIRASPRCGDEFVLNHEECDGALRSLTTLTSTHFGFGRLLKMACARLDIRYVSRVH